MKDVIIRKISIYKFSIPLKEPFITSLGPEYAANNIVVKMETNGSITGIGECSPYRTINGESQNTCFEVGQYLAKELKGKDATAIEENHAIMDKIIYANTSIKSAFDMAMYDIAAQQADMPLYRFLGGKIGKKIVTDYTISLQHSNSMIAQSVALKEQGFSIIKVKLGSSPEKDVKTMEGIRNAVGQNVSLRIDVNQGWSYSDAIIALKGMSDMHIQYCEEPIPRWNWMQLKNLRKKSPVRIMADESCLDEHDAERLIKQNSCSMFNLKLGKSSGIFRARKIISRAEAAGMEMQVGGFLESKIGMTANAHLALSSENIRYYDFDTPLMFREDPTIGGISYHDGGEVKLPAGNGLGVQIEEKRLRELEQITI